MASEARRCSRAASGSPVFMRAAWASAMAVRASATSGSKTAGSAPRLVTSFMSAEMEPIAVLRRSRIASRSDLAEKIASVWCLAIMSARWAVSSELSARVRSLSTSRFAVAIAVSAVARSARACSGLSCREASIWAG